MSDSQKVATSAEALEIAYAVFMDIVGYSHFPTDYQPQLIAQLMEAIQGSPTFREVQSRDEMISLPAGDGVVLVFFRDPIAPVRCAMEISRILSQVSVLKLRIGIHSGPVYRIADINANRNVAGGGINMAQRTMEAGMQDTSCCHGPWRKSCGNSRTGSRICRIWESTKSSMAYGCTCSISALRKWAIRPSQRNWTRREWTRKWSPC